jgi:hypothetical protein
MGLDGDDGVGVDHNHRRLIVGDVGGVHHFGGAAAAGRHQAGRDRRQQEEEGNQRKGRAVSPRRRGDGALELGFGGVGLRKG